MVKIIKRKTAMEFAEIKHLFTKNEEAFLNEIIRNPKFLERILLNSETLYNKLKKIIDNNKKIDKKTKKTLVKYLLRMASRPQPFRFNSGICLDQPNQFNGKKQIKKVEISLEWEQKLMKKVDDSLLRSTSVKLVLNPRLYMKDKQSILEKYVNNSTSYIYINNSEFIDELFELLKKPISLQDVLNQYRKDYDEKLIFDVIQKLIRVDIIKTELSSPSIDRDSDTFFEKIKQICGHDKVLISELEDIQYSLEMYKRAEIGEGICLYKDLINKMSSLCKSSSYVIVDLYLHDSMDGREEVISHVNVDDEMQILNLFDKRQTFDWESYYNSFISKYGFYTRVPLLHMIDRDEGLGLPQHLQLNSKNRKIEEYILNRIMQSNFKNDGILKLTSNDYRNIKDIYDNEEGEYRIPISYDCKMVPHEGRLILHPNAFSFPRNSFTGRFSFLKREKKWINVTKYSEINYTSNYFKDIGLTYRSESSTFIDCIGQTKNSIDRIPLNEIDMIAHNGRFYMVYQDEVIYPVSTHLVSYRNFNEHPALIFLNEFYRYCFEYPSDFPVDKFSFLEFIPRVDYKHFILSPARINIKFQQENTKEERINKINEMINNYNLNQFKYIYILEADRALPVPTNNNLSVQFMETCKQKVGGEYVLTLMEAPELENAENEISDWIYSSEHKMFASEENGHNQVKKILKITRDFTDEIDINVSSYFLYYRSGKREKVERAILKLSEEQLLEDMFMVNFIDENNKEHIRLRYRKDNNNDIELENILSVMLASGDIYDFKKTLFYPEINRYGGKKIYKIVYKLFAADTSSMGIFKGLYANYNEIGSALYLSSFILLELLGNDIDLLYDYLEYGIEKDSKYVKPFAKRRNEHCDIVLQSLQDYQRKSNSLLLERKSLSNEILISAEKVGLSKEEIFYLVKSIIHMSMNRHFPFKRDLEIEANQFMRFAFSNIRNKLGKVSQLL